MPAVSVIMPVYNGGEYLAEAIESILAQTLGDFELIIVDDCSTDGSAESIAAYAERDRRIRALAHPRNRGQGAAQSTGLAEARGDFITLMDADDVSFPQRLAKQVEFLRDNPEIGALGACCRAMNHDLSRTLFEFSVPREHALIAFNLFFGASIVGATLMTRAKHLKAVGYAEERRHSPDLDLSMRLLWQERIRFANLPDCLLLYRRHDGAKQNAESRGIAAASRQIRGEMLERLWGEASTGTLDRFERLRRQEKLTWAERRFAKRDLRRLINALLSHTLVDAAYEALLINAMNGRLEEASPRLWQKFCHWRRYRLPWLFADKALAGSAGGSE